MSKAMLMLEELMHKAWVMSEMDGEKVALSRVSWQTKATASQNSCAYRVNNKRPSKPRKEDYRAVV